MRICFLLLLLSLGVSAQDEALAEFRLQINVSPNYSHGLFEDGRRLFSQLEKIEFIDEGTDAIFGYNVGVGISNYSRTKRESFETGVNFSSIGYSKTRLITPPNIPQKKRERFNLYHLELPLVVKRPIAKSKGRVYVILGGSASAFLYAWARSESSINGETIITSEEWDRILPNFWTFQVLTGMGTEFPISQNFNLAIEPMARLSLTPVYARRTRASDKRYYSYTFGVKFALSYDKFKIKIWPIQP